MDLGICVTNFFRWIIEFFYQKDEMKNKIYYFLIIISLIFIFFIFYQGLKKSNIYEPKSKIKNLPQFSAITFFDNEKMNSKEIFDQNNYYLFNIWASWCLPCKNEHPLLSKLSKNRKIEIIGLNYKDNFENAKIFLQELGNPYNKILIDRDGTIAIEWGAIGVPETFLIYNNKIVKKFVGPLNEDSLESIKKIIK